jgi:hypothetical protein
MTSRELKRIFQKGECLSLDTIRSYQQGKLSAKSMHEVETHLLACSLCATASESYSLRHAREINKVVLGVERRLAIYMNTPPRTSFFKRFGMALTGSVVLIGILAAALWFILGSRKTPQSSTDSAYMQQTEHTPAVLTQH